MWSQYYHSTVSQLLLESLLKLCSENIPCEEKLEIDGIICISPGDVTKQIVVKVHEIVERGRQHNWQRQINELSPECSTGFLPDDDLCGEKENESAEEQSQLRRLITQSKELKRSLFDNDDEKDVKDDSPVPELKSLLPSRQIVPFTKRKGKRHKGRLHRDVMRWANGHQPSSATGSCDYQISIDQPTVIEDQSGLDDQSGKVASIGEEVSKAQSVSSVLSDVDLFGRSSLNEDGGRAIACRICHKYFDRYINLQAHNMEIHKRWTCKQCYTTFSMRCNLRRHERLHAGHKPHPCRICDKAFSRKGDLRIHEMKHEAAGDVCNIICEACNQFFSSRSQYDKHACPSRSGKRQVDLDEDSSSMPASTDDLPCIEVPSSQVSNQEDSNNSSLDPSGHSGGQGEANPSHSLLSDSLASGLASGGKVFTKIERDASPSQSLLYNDNSNWSSFLTIPSPQRSRQVSPVPGSADVSQDSNNISSNSGSVAKISTANLASNSLEPSEDKDFTCCLCKLPFLGYSSYDEHCQRQHLRFPCHLCDQTFTNRNNRSRHVRNHTGNKCYSCEKCGKSFTRSDILREHQIIHTESYIGDTCTYCGLSIKKKAELLAHIKKCCRKRKSCLPLESATADLKSARASKCSSPSIMDNGQ